ncbi:MULTISPECIES: hypothetical protein [unclassified Leptolyngbya]|nr:MULTISPECIES: hypothetical protein [unclassified Leptolyngbya]MBD1910204.1 hypothetical protein [Leptolyngbya sp. FACHB-8]MBD2153408.1 hypothetical protein [Leptolyngbya sp. FACHB-16]
MPIEISPLIILSTVALLLMLLVTGGVAYLTAIDWRDRRRQDQERRGKR